MMKKRTVTVVIPAHNEERYVSRCIGSIRKAAEFYGGEVEIIVVCNRCTDSTADIARELGARVLTNEDRFIGGGAPIRFERYSLPLYLNDLLCRTSFAATGLYCGIFWAEKRTFTEVGGFVEKKAMEDAATAKRLRAYGKALGKRYTTLRHNCLINSTRKYDDLGDWLYLKLMIQNAGALARAALGDRTDLDKLLDRLFYDYNG